MYIDGAIAPFVSVAELRGGYGKKDEKHNRGAGSVRSTGIGEATSAELFPAVPTAAAGVCLSALSAPRLHLRRL